MKWKYACNNINTIQLNLRLISESVGTNMFVCHFFITLFYFIELKVN